MDLEKIQEDQENIEEDADYIENIQLMLMDLHHCGLKDLKLQVGGSLEETMDDLLMLI